MSRAVLVAILVAVVVAVVYFGVDPAKAALAIDTTVPKPAPIPLPNTPNVGTNRATGQPVELGVARQGTINTAAGPVPVQSAPLRPGVTSLFKPGTAFQSGGR